MISKANAEWQGSLKQGRGTMKPAHAEGIGFTLGSRFEGSRRVTPRSFSAPRSRGVSPWR